MEAARASLLQLDEKSSLRQQHGSQHVYTTQFCSDCFAKLRHQALPLPHASLAFRFGQGVLTSGLHDLGIVARSVPEMLTFAFCVCAVLCLHLLCKFVCSIECTSIGGLSSQGYLQLKSTRQIRTQTLSYVGPK